jgi:hypothetical protein
LKSGDDGIDLYIRFFEAFSKVDQSFALFSMTRFPVLLGTSAVAVHRGLASSAARFGTDGLAGVTLDYHTPSCDYVIL